MRKPSTKSAAKSYKYVIEDNIPIPPAIHSTGITAAVRSLKIGQSVFIPHVKETSQFGGIFKHVEGRFTTRKVEGGGVRVWRIE